MRQGWCKYGQELYWLYKIQIFNNIWLTLVLPYEALNTFWGDWKQFSSIHWFQEGKIMPNNLTAIVIKLRVCFSRSTSFQDPLPHPPKSSLLPACPVIAIEQPQAAKDLSGSRFNHQQRWTNLVEIQWNYYTAYFCILRTLRETYLMQSLAAVSICISFAASFESCLLEVSLFSLLLCAFETPSWHVVSSNSFREFSGCRAYLLHRYLLDIFRLSLRKPLHSGFERRLSKTTLKHAEPETCFAFGTNDSDDIGY